MKKSLIFALSAVLTLALNADVMKWQVNDSANLSGYNGARLMSSTSKTTQGGTVIAETDLVSGAGDIVKVDMSTIQNANALWYYIEVGNYTGDNFTAATVAGAYSYTDLVNAGLISTGSMTPASTSMFGQAGVTIAGSPMSYGPVPEPSAAMLMLLGIAVAGLKRRRA